MTSEDEAKPLSRATWLGFFTSPAAEGLFPTPPPARAPLEPLEVRVVGFVQTLSNEGAGVPLNLLLSHYFPEGTHPGTVQAALDAAVLADELEETTIPDHMGRPVRAYRPISQE